MGSIPTYPIRPKLLRGAFIEYGFSLPPLAFAFQFNPETLTRGRTATYTARGAGGTGTDGGGCREGSEQMDRSCLAQVSVTEENISLTLQLDATDDLDSGDGLTQTIWHWAATLSAGADDLSQDRPTARTADWESARHDRSVWRGPGQGNSDSAVRLGTQARAAGGDDQSSDHRAGVFSRSQSRSERVWRCS